MRSIEVSAKTRELAIKDALEQLGVGRDEVHVEILDEGSKGIFGFGSRHVKLKVTTEVPGPAPARGGHAHGQVHSHVPRHSDQPRHEQPRHHERAERPERNERPPRQPEQQHPRRERPQQQEPRQHPQGRQQHPPRQQHGQQRHTPAPQQGSAPRPTPPPRPAPAPRPPRPPRPEQTAVPATPHTPGPPDPEAEALLNELITRMGIEAKISSETLESGEVSLKVDSPDSAILIGRKGRSLASLQYLINRMIQRGEGEDAGERITVDIEGYLGRRQEALEDLAVRLAHRAKESGRRQRTKPMTPQERRIIHVALEGDEDIRTFSVGDPAARYVIIAPKDEKPGSDEERSSRDRGPRGGRGRRGGGGRDHGPRNGGERRPHAPRDADAAPANGEAGEAEGNGDQETRDNNGAPRRRRRFRRGGRGRGPRPEGNPPEGNAPQSDSPESDSNES